MILNSVSAEERLGTLSKGKIKLLELLLEKESRHAQQIRIYSRDDSFAGVRSPASWAQQRLWFIDQLEGGGAAYHSAVAVRLRGALDQGALHKALDTLVQRHEVLRTVFVDVEGDAMQEATAESRFALKVIDLNGYDEAGREAQIRLQKIEEAQERFDLRLGPLIRGRLLQVQEREHVLLVTMHHIVSDGWSMGVLIREFTELYSAYREGRDDPLEPLPIQYADYAHWQREWLQGRILERQLSYWRARLEGAAPELELPADRPRSAVQGYRGRSIEVVLDAQLSADLNALAKRHGMTRFMVLYAGWAILLSRLSGQEDIVIGTPVANRRRPELEGLIGFFVNALVLRIEVTGDLLLKEFLERVKETTLAAYDHQDMPFEKVVEVLRPQRSLGRHPVFQVMFALQNAPQSEWTLPGLTVTLEDGVNETSKFDLLLSLEEQGDAIIGCVNYDTDLFDRETVTRWIECFTVLLKGMTSREQSRIIDLPILPESERRQLIELLNATQATYPNEKSIHELFEEQVERRPNAVAAVWEGKSFTYAELNGKANQLARYLRSQGVAAGEYVPILMSRSFQMLVAELAVLKSGGVYVPMDTQVPAERLAFMIRDCSARLILTGDEAPADLEIEQVRRIDCREVADMVANHTASNLKLQMEWVPPAYVMYTSGSTGVPKGVVVPHHAVNRLAINNGYAQIGPGDCIAHYSNPAFDASTFEIWGALLNGARVAIVPQSVVLDAAHFAAALKQEQVTLLWMTVGLFNQYIDALANVFSELRYLIVGGDNLEPGAIRRVLLGSPPQHLLNAYGPTECTTFSTTHLIEFVEEEAKSIPIGRPISNARIYILDSHGQVVPIGVAGEIYIGGAGVACGYLNRPELTAERFLPDPFDTDPRARLYRTGDLGRWRVGGAIEFLGRNDHQVKIRGFRIELGEIEAQLARHAQVKEAVVVTREDATGGKRLVAYVTQRGQSSLNVAELREHLRRVLPEYMVPSAFVVLESLPLTSSGKLNRRSLPVPELDAYASRQYEPPQGEVEEVLAAIWRELLQIERVGREDSFFELGGHSLLAVKALFKTNQSFGSSLRVTDLYKSSTIRELATRILVGTTEDEFVDLSRESALDERIVTKSVIRCASAEAVMLTGATGFVGRFLLAQLLQDTDATIYCLVRAQSEHGAFSRLKASLSKWDLWRDEFERRVVAVPGDLRLPRLGIDERTYQALCQSIDSVYHCATSMNHLETYAMAKPANVEAVRELLRFATCHKTKLMNYISTLSVFSSSAADAARVVNEKSAIDREKHSISSGYAASKWIGEKIVMTAGERGVPCNIFRLGLVWADTQQGRYDELQREYRIFKSCLLSGCGIRNYRYDAAPTPVDYVAHAVVFLAGRHCDGQGVFHISSSHQTIEDVFERCNKTVSTPLELVSLYDWICEMKKLHHKGWSLPAVPLIEYAFSMDEASFYEHQRSIRCARIRFDCARTHRELEHAGIVAPALNDDLLGVFVRSMLSRDAECQELIDGSSSPMLRERQGGFKFDDLGRSSI